MDDVDDVKWVIARQIPHLRRFAITLAKNSDLADDLVQDCLERALRKRHLWHRRGSLRSWLFRMLYRTHLDHHRGRRRGELSADSEFVDTVVSQPPNQEHRVECQNIGAALDLLPEQQRVAVLLVALEGFAYDEAAEIMKVPIGTVRSRLSRARQALRGTRPAGSPSHILRRVK